MEQCQKQTNGQYDKKITKQLNAVVYGKAGFYESIQLTSCCTFNSKDSKWVFLPNEYNNFIYLIFVTVFIKKINASGKIV
jgi:hypothetical protein